MKGLILHCRRFEYKDTKGSNWPKGVVNTKLDRDKFKDAVVVLTCIEKGDTSEYVRSAVQRIIRLNKDFYKRKQIIISPFAHLSNNLEEPKKAIQLLEEFQNLLQLEGYLIGSVSFGTHKDALFDVIGTKASVSYFEFPQEKQSLK